MQNNVFFSLLTGCIESTSLLSFYSMHSNLPIRSILELHNVDVSDREILVDYL